MSKVEITVVRRKSLAKGLIAGMVGGLAGTAAMVVAERLFPARGQSGAASTRSGDGVRWGFGAALGAAYGAVAEFYPQATAREGASFGLALEALTHQGVLPALGLLMKNSAGDGAAEMTAHVVYGVTTETVRGFLRQRL